MTTTEDFRNRYLIDPYDHFPRQEFGEEFDRWLENVVQDAYEDGFRAGLASDFGRNGATG